MSTIKLSGINRVVQQLRFLFVFALHSGKPALIANPVADKTEDVDAPCVWGV